MLSPDSPSNLGKPSQAEGSLRAEVRRCKDGSGTLYSPVFEQHYHNPNGAVAESLHVFFESTGIPESLQAHHPVHVLEIGFGTGLNALLLADLKRSLNSNSVISFQSIEAWPITSETFLALRYADNLNHPDLAAKLAPLFDSLQSGTASLKILLDMRISVYKGLFNGFAHQPSDSAYTHIFHDPFSPEVNSELWTPEVFSQIASWCEPDTMLATYCAASKARAAMAAGGWKTARAPGALGKREMTIASRSESRLASFRRLNDVRLISRFYPDWGKK